MTRSAAEGVGLFVRPSGTPWRRWEISSCWRSEAEAARGCAVPAGVSAGEWLGGEKQPRKPQPNTTTENQQVNPTSAVSRSYKDRMAGDRCKMEVPDAFCSCRGSPKQE